MEAKQALKRFERNLKLCLSKDRHRLRRKIRKISSQIDAGKVLKTNIATLATEVESSMAYRQARLQNIPSFEYPDLPVAEKKDQIAKAIRENQVVIVCGETGSGKTTQLPKICLSIGRGIDGLIGHTQPRRIAARSVGNRIAEELGESLGHSVGYKIRFQDQTRDSTYIKLMTDGILLAEIQTNPFLDQYDTIILDEAHERSLNIDFLMGYLKWLLPKRRDLKIIITSAT
ncbi:MAG: DEAD/DEAH box helicase, partial [Methylococcales bacterium]